jgi:hypothetical protein
MFIAGPAGESQSLDRLFHNLFAGLGLDAALVW